MLNIYLYSVSSISLIILYVAGYVLFDALLRFLFGVDTGISTRQAIAAGLGYTAIAFPLWRIHWQWLIQHIATGQSALRIHSFHSGQAPHSAFDFHRRYLFIVTGINIAAMLFGGGISIMSLAQLALGASTDVGMTCVNIGRAFFIFLLSTALWLHHWQEFDEEEKVLGMRQMAGQGAGD